VIVPSLSVMVQVAVVVTGESLWTTDVVRVVEVVVLTFRLAVYAYSDKIGV
jgi:hypothetical protein